MIHYIPYQGCGELRFGMSQEAVEALLGPPKLSMLNWLGEKQLVYELYSIGFGKSNSVVEIMFYPEACVVLDSVDIMSLPNGREYLLRRSKEKYIGNGSIILLDLGIAIPDDEELESDNAIAVFAKGWRDELIRGYKRLR